MYYMYVITSFRYTLNVSIPYKNQTARQSCGGLCIPDESLSYTSTVSSDSTDKNQSYFPYRHIKVILNTLYNIIKLTP
jgi:hypothetical protein